MPPRQRSARSPSRSPTPKTVRDPKYPPGLGFTPKTAPPPRSPLVPPTPTVADDDMVGKGTLPCLAYVALYHAAALGALLAGHWRAYGVLNPTHAALSLFLVINAWICVCEIALLILARSIFPTHTVPSYTMLRRMVTRSNEYVTIQRHCVKTAHKPHVPSVPALKQHY